MKCLALRNGKFDIHEMSITTVWVVKYYGNLAFCQIFSS